MHTFLAFSLRITHVPKVHMLPQQTVMPMMKKNERLALLLVHLFTTQHQEPCFQLVATLLRFPSLPQANDATITTYQWNMLSISK